MNAPAAPARVRLTPRGRWTFVVGAIALTMGLIAGDDRLLLGAALAAAAPLLSRLYLRRALAGIEVSWEPPAEVFAHEPFEVPVRVRKASGERTACGVELDARALRRRGRALLRVLPGGADARLRLAGAFPRRGRALLAGMSLRTSFPWGLAQATAEARAPVEVLVLPNPSPVPARRLWQLAAAAEARAALHLPPRLRDPEEFHRLVPWEPGMKVRHLHAAASARLGVPVARELRGEPDGTVLIALDAAPPARPDRRFPGRFELGIGRAAALVVRFAREGTRHRLVAGAALPASGRAALRVLAPLEPARDGTPSLAGESGTLIWISAAHRPAPRGGGFTRVVDLSPGSDR